ncbi:hypothetical protein GIJ05_01455 [Laceyella tengchongensis]|nr:hypothetical protein [Laceyella tengchongensis]
MMNIIDRAAFGEYIRRVRKQQKLQQKDLVDDVLTQPLLSLIETGKPGVSEDKMRYVLKKLNSSRDLSDFYIIENDEENKDAGEEIIIKLNIAENLIDLLDPDEGLEMIRKLDLSDDNPFIVYGNYLKGKVFMHKKNWKKAHKYFHDTIYNIQHQFEDLAYSNLQAAAYHELGIIAYLQNNYREALACSQRASMCFLPDGEREYYQEMILISKAIYLQNLNDIDGAQSTLDEMENIIFPKEKNHRKCFSKEAALNMYDVRSSLFMKSKMYKQAIQYALKGIELARIDKMYNRLCELWTTLGKIHVQKNKLDLAQLCFETALKFEKLIDSQSLLSYIYNQLGLLYSKSRENKKAIDNSLRAAKFAKKANNAFRYCEALIMLGQLYFKEHQNDEAIQILNEARELSKQHSFQDLKNRINLILGKQLVKLGDPNANKFIREFFDDYADTLEGGEEKMIRRSIGEPPSG